MVRLHCVLKPPSERTPDQVRCFGAIVIYDYESFSTPHVANAVFAHIIVFLSKFANRVIAVAAKVSRSTTRLILAFWKTAAEDEMHQRRITHQSKKGKEKSQKPAQ